MATAHRRWPCLPRILPSAVLVGLHKCASLVKDRVPGGLLPAFSAWSQHAGTAQDAYMRATCAGHLHGTCATFVLVMALASFALTQAAAGRRHG